LDRSGCDTIEVNSTVYKMRNDNMERVLKGEASITEDGTGIELSTVSQAAISNVISKVSFVDADSNYKSGIPFSGLARTNLQDQPYVYGNIVPDYGKANLNLKPFYSRNKSFLKLHSLDKVLPCEGQQEVQVEYIIKHTELKNGIDHFDLHYLVTFKGSVQDYGSLEISTENKNEDLHGKATLKLPLSAGTSSTFRALVYTILPDGDIVADSAKYRIQQCLQNK
ncbi:hypothetical protein AB205_0108640, partial [Aquarana catesbeiana]